MVKMFKYSIALMVASLALLVQADWLYDSSAKTITDGNWTFNVGTVTGGLRLNSRASGSGVLDLSTKVSDGSGNEYAIKQFYDSFMANCSDLTELVLPATLTTINQKAFQGCSNLTQVSIPENNALTTMTGQRIFQECTSLKSFPFDRCTELTEIGSYMFNLCSALEGDISLSAMTNLRTIAQYAFLSCTSVTSIDMRNNALLTSIGASAFSGTGARNIIFPPALSSLGKDAIGNCSSLTNVVFQNYPASINSGWAYNFSRKYWLCIHVPKTVGSGWLSAGCEAAMTKWEDMLETGAYGKEKYTANFGASAPVPYAIGNSSTLGVVLYQWIFLDEVEGPKKATFSVVNNLSDTSTGTPTPSYGDSEMDVGSTVECSIGRYGSKGTALYEAYEGVFSKYNEDAERFEDIRTNGIGVSSVTLDEKATYRYLWNFRLSGYKPEVEMPKKIGTRVLGTVTEKSTPDVDGGYYFLGNEASYVAAAMNGSTFEHWIITTNKTTCCAGSNLTFAVTSKITIKPYFKTPEFSYDWNTKCLQYRLSDGYNSFAVTNYTGGVEAALTVGHLSGESVGKMAADPYVWDSATTNELDLTIPIQGGYSITKLGAHAFDSMPVIVKLDLPATLTEIDTLAFANYTTLRTLVFNSLPTIAPDAFTGVAANQIEFCIPRNNADWEAFLADSSKFTPWGSVSSELREAWKAAHPSEHKPLGLTMGYNRQWVRYTIDKAPGLSIFVR